MLSVSDRDGFFVCAVRRRLLQSYTQLQSPNDERALDTRGLLSQNSTMQCSPKLCFSKSIFFSCILWDFNDSIAQKKRNQWTRWIHLCNILLNDPTILH